ncbi:DVU0298 family protein [Thermosulfuriphilus sp.]
MVKWLPTRTLKGEILKILKEEDLPSLQKKLFNYPPRKVINPLIGALCHGDEVLRFRAVAAIGEVVLRLAEEDMEAARVIMRRLMWMLNEESGGIGWGVPEAMGEIMARHPGLAEEYAHMLISYLREDGNFLEYEPLQRGVLWGVARLAVSRPDILINRRAPGYIRPFLRASDPLARAMAVLALGLLKDRQSRREIALLLEDDTPVEFFWWGEPINTKIKHLAEEALARINRP